MGALLFVLVALLVILHVMATAAEQTKRKRLTEMEVQAILSIQVSP